MKKAIAFALSALAGGVAFAEGEGRSHAANPDVPVPPPSYQSALQDYRAYKEQEVASWRELNEEVARMGGHMGVLKADAGKPQAKAGQPAAAPAGHGHGGAR